MINNNITRWFFITLTYSQSNFYNSSIIDDDTFSIFVLIQSEPRQSVSKLASEIGRSTLFVKKRIEQMKKLELLRPNSEIDVPFLGRRDQTEVEAQYNPFSIGLQRIHVFFDGIPNADILRKLEIILSIHPYSHYQCLSFYYGATLYIQFDIAPSGIRFLKEFLDELQKENYFIKYELLKQKNSFHSNFDFSRWQSKTSKWSIFSQYMHSMNSVQSDLELMWDSYDKYNKMNYNQYHSEFVFEFDDVDYKLLRELTVNARVNISKIKSRYDIDRSRLSRRINRLRELVITEDKLIFDNQFFNISQTYIIRGEISLKDNRNKLSNFIKTGNIPFNSSISWNKDLFIWLIQCPVNFITDIAKLIWKLSSWYKIINLDLNSAQEYYFNNLNYEKRGKWITNRNYIVNTPFELLSNIEGR